MTQWPFYTSQHSQAPTFGIFYGCLQNRQHFIAYVMFDIAGERYLKRLPRQKREKKWHFVMGLPQEEKYTLGCYCLCLCVVYLYPPTSLVKVQVFSYKFGLEPCHFVL